MLNVKINSKLTWIFLGIMLIGVVFLIEREFILTKQEINILIQKEANSNASILKQIQRERILYLINKGSGNTNSYQISPSQNSTVFSLLEELAKRENFKIEFTIYKGMGVFIEGIDGVKNGTDNKYWQYWVNEELPMVAADEMKVKGGEKIEWKFAPATF